MIVMDVSAMSSIRMQTDNAQAGQRIDCKRVSDKKERTLSLHVSNEFHGILVVWIVNWTVSI